MIDLVLASASPRRQELLRQIGLVFDVVAADIDERRLEGEPPSALVARLSRQKAEAGARAYLAARAKARAGVALAPAPASGTPGLGRPPAPGGILVIAADTVVVLDGEVLGKPRGAAENRDYLARLSDRTHQVLTGHTLRLVGLSGGAGGPAVGAATEGGAGLDGAWVGAAAVGAAAVAAARDGSLVDTTVVDTTVVDTTVVDTAVRFRKLDAGEIERYVASREGLDKAGGYGVQGLGAVLVRSIEGCYANVVGLSLPTVVERARRLGVTLA